MGVLVTKADPFAGWLIGGGEMGERIRAFDWSKTSIGSPETWSPALRMMIRFLLANRFPWLLWWGPQYVSIYNDAYRPVLGTKHPWALGQPLSECWKEIWHILEPLVDTPFKGGPATWNDDILLEINRHGFVEETHFTIAYSPVPDEDAATGIGGVLATVHEITEKVVGERRVSALRDLGAATIERKTAEQACLIAADTLAKYTKDVPFALIYLIASEEDQAHLACAAGTDQGGRFCPKVLEIDSRALHPWSRALSEIVRTKNIQIVDGLADHFGDDVPTGPWSDPPRQALVLPIRASIAHEVTAVLITGVSARLKLNEPYRAFYELLASQITTVIANARAYDEERKRAEALAAIDRAKTTFFSNVSHEFRTPLTLMLGPIEDTLNRSQGLPPADRERLETAHRNSVRLLKLVNTLLDFSRIEAGRIEASYEQLDLARLTAELASLFRSAIEHAGMQLVVNCPPLSGTVYVDREMWEKIVLNLLSNAFKFTFEGEISVSLKERASSAELTIRDTGTGIPTQELPRLFERFHRVKDARSRSYEGSGIGLALVQELVKLHGGFVQVESEIGWGSSFTVSVPLGLAHLPPDRIRASRTLASTSLQPKAYIEELLRWLPEAHTEDIDGDNLFLQETAMPARPLAPPQESPHILLADDNADMRGYVRRLLASTGYEVETVGDGLTALRAARERKPDLVVTDVMMPELDGYGLLKRLRADPDLRHVPVIFLSARAGEDARIEGMHAGADDYLIKPFGARELLARVDAHLRLARLRQEATQSLLYSAAQFETLLSKAPLGVYLVDADLRIRHVNPTALFTFGDIPGGLIGRGLDEIVHVMWERDYADETVRIFEHTLATGESYVAKERAEIRADRGVMEYYEWRVDRIQLPDGNLGVVCYFREISELVQAANTQRLLLNELNHRVKNTLANVQAIAQQTLRSTRDPSDFANRFGGRVQALARAHSMLTEQTWQSADLRELIYDQVLRGTIDESRLSVRGPIVRLSPNITLHLAMMLHELGTNSIKYGALSCSAGSIGVRWICNNHILNLQWVERGGPPVKAFSARGFGTTLIEQSAKSEGGAAEMVIEAKGVTWKIALPLPVSEATSSSSKTLGPRPSSPIDESPTLTSANRLFPGKAILVVEDEPLIGLDIVSTLEKAGARVSGPVGTEKEAIELIERGYFDAALLDANLHGRSVDVIAAMLNRRNIPFLFVTGYGKEGLPEAFKQAVALPKPFSERQLIDAVVKLNLPQTNVLRLKR
jgi:PAS domain S-box-containing protein